MTKWFGESWGASVCQGEHVDTPVGVLCAHCDEPIAEGDQGVMIDGLFGDRVGFGGRQQSEQIGLQRR